MLTHQSVNDGPMRTQNLRDTESRPVGKLPKQWYIPES